MKYGFFFGYLLIWNYLYNKSNLMTGVCISGQDSVAAAVTAHDRQVTSKPFCLRAVWIINKNPSTAKNYIPCCEGLFNGHLRNEMP